MESYTERIKNQSIVARLNHSVQTQLSMTNSHPLTEERFEKCLETLEANKQIYRDEGCDLWMIQKFFRYCFPPSVPTVNTFNEPSEVESTDEPSVDSNVETL